MTWKFPHLLLCRKLDPFVNICFPNDVILGCRPGDEQATDETVGKPCLHNEQAKNLRPKNAAPNNVEKPPGRYRRNAAILNSDPVLRINVVRLSCEGRIRTRLAI